MPHTSMQHGRARRVSTPCAFCKEFHFRVCLNLTNTCYITNVTNTLSPTSGTGPSLGNWVHFRSISWNLPHIWDLENFNVTTVYCCKRKSPTPYKNRFFKGHELSYARIDMRMAPINSFCYAHFIDVHHVRISF